MKSKQRYAITLLEIMIVIFLIGLIGGVVGYNVKASLDKGKAFKTEHAMAQIREILLLELENPSQIALIRANPIECVRRSSLCKNPEALIKDGWGELFQITISDTMEIMIVSDKFSRYRNDHDMPK